MTPTCSFPNCDRKHFGHGYCNPHYRQWRRGTALKPIRDPNRTDEQRFFDHVQYDSDPAACWIWSGAIAGGGYGAFAMFGKNTVAHRWIYSHLIAAIPDGLDLDHLCRNRACVNPWHLEPVTRRVNTLRGIAKERQLQIAAARTHCKRGHEYAGANLGSTRKGSRYCRECKRISKAALAKSRLS